MLWIEGDDEENIESTGRWERLGIGMGVLSPSVLVEEDTGCARQHQLG